MPRCYIFISMTYLHVLQYNNHVYPYALLEICGIELLPVVVCIFLFLIPSIPFYFHQRSLISYMTLLVIAENSLCLFGNIKILPLLHYPLGTCPLYQL